MKVTLNAEAARYIREKGGHLVLYHAPGPGCCGTGDMLFPSLEVGPPRLSPDQYRSIDQDGIQIHIDRDLDAQGEHWRVSLNKVLFWRSLAVARVDDHN